MDRTFIADALDYMSSHTSLFYTAGPLSPWEVRICLGYTLHVRRKTFSSIPWWAKIPSRGSSPTQRTPHHERSCEICRMSADVSKENTQKVKSRDPKAKECLCGCYGFRWYANIDVVSSTRYGLLTVDQFMAEGCNMTFLFFRLGALLHVDHSVLARFFVVPWSVDWSWLYLW
jgi:hypothetical protein